MRNMCNWLNNRPTPEPCQINTTNGCRFNACECEGIEIPPAITDLLREETSICCDENGVCKVYKVKCRNRFWPSFSHPRWLCCDDLYCAKQ